MDCHAVEALEHFPDAWCQEPAEVGCDFPKPSAKAWSGLKHRADASGEEATTPESYGRRAGEMAARGFGILKFDVDVPTPYETDEYNRDLSHLRD